MTEKIETPSSITPLADILATALLRAQFRILELEEELDRCHTCRHYDPPDDPEEIQEIVTAALEELAQRLKPQPEDQSP